MTRCAAAPGPVLTRLTRRYPEIRTALHYENVWQLLVVTVLSAQTLDDTVNRVAPELFARWPAPEDLAAADPEEVEAVIYPTGFFRQKTKSVMTLSQAIVEGTTARYPRTSRADRAARGRTQDRQRRGRRGVGHARHRRGYPCAEGEPPARADRERQSR